MSVSTQPLALSIVLSVVARPSSSQDAVSSISISTYTIHRTQASILVRAGFARQITLDDDWLLCDIIHHSLGCVSERMKAGSEERVIVYSKSKRDTRGSG